MSQTGPARRRRRICLAVVFGCVLAVFGSAADGQSKGDAARGAAKAAACAACHGTPERPPLAGMPTLAGQQEEFLVLQLILLREGLREVPQMADLFKGWSDPELQDVAAYFSRQRMLPGSADKDPQRYERGASLARAMGCGSCHLADFSGQQQVPRIARQREDYLLASLKAYRDNKRTGTDTNMNGVLYQVPDGDLAALAHYLAHQ
jgi:cytochrome c553